MVHDSGSSVRSTTNKNMNDIKPMAISSLKMFIVVLWKGVSSASSSRVSKATSVVMMARVMMMKETVPFRSSILDRDPKTDPLGTGKSASEIMSYVVCVIVGSWLGDDVGNDVICCLCYCWKLA